MGYGSFDGTICVYGVAIYVYGCACLFMYVYMHVCVERDLFLSVCVCADS